MTWSVATPTWVAPLGQHAHHGQHDAAGGADLLPVVGGTGRLSEELAEQLVGPVHEVDLHGRSLAVREVS